MVSYTLRRVGAGLVAAAVLAGNVGSGASAAPEGGAAAALAERQPLAPRAGEPAFGAPIVTDLGTLWPAGRATDVVGVPANDGQPHGAPTGTTTLNPTEDSFTSSERPNENFGSDSRLYVGQRSGYGATRSYVYWNVKSLPRNEVVLGGDIRMYQSGAAPSGDAGRDVPVKRIDASWKESSITWSNAPPVNDERQDTVNCGTSSTWRTWDVDKMAQRWWNGQWTNQGAFFQGYEADGSYRQFDSRSAGNRPELVLEVAIDSLPPTSHVLPMAPYTNTNPMLVRWTGADPAPGTGIAFFTLWAKRNNEAWQVVGDALTGTSALFQGDNGNQYSFRSQAYDYAGNVESPPEAPQATTLLDVSKPVSAITPLPAFSQASFTVNWTGTDYPQGAGQQASGVQHYDVQIQILGGPWGDLALGVQQPQISWTGDNGVSYGFRVRAVDKAWNAEDYVATTATIVDTAPPTVLFEPASGLDSPTFTVTWRGDDHGGSGVQSYDVQVQEDQGPWTDWMTGTAATSGAYTGAFGHVYGFRARARDTVGNLGTYPTNRQLSVPVVDSSTLTVHIYIPWLQQ